MEGREAGLFSRISHILMQPGFCGCGVGGLSRPPTRTAHVPRMHVAAADGPNPVPQKRPTPPRPCSHSRVLDVFGCVCVCAHAAGPEAFRHINLVLAADGSCMGAAVVAAAATHEVKA